MLLINFASFKKKKSRINEMIFSVTASSASNTYSNTVSPHAP